MNSSSGDGQRPSIFGLSRSNRQFGQQRFGANLQDVSNRPSPANSSGERRAHLPLPTHFLQSAGARRLSSPYSESPGRAAAGTHDENETPSPPQTIVSSAYMRHPGGNTSSLRSFTCSTPKAAAEEAPKPSGVAFDDISSAISSLSSDYKRVSEELRVTQDDLSRTKEALDDKSARLDAATAQLATLSPEVENLRSAYASSAGELKGVSAELAASKTLLEELKEELKECRATLSETMTAYTQEQCQHEYLKKLAGSWKTSVADLKKRQETVSASLAQIGKESTAAVSSTQKMLEEVSDLRLKAKDALATLESLQDPSKMVTVAQETKAVIKELQDNAADSLRVNDMLRDRLHVQSFQLLEAQGRIKDLEAERETALKDVFSARADDKKRLSLIVEMEQNFATLTNQLSKNQEGLFSALEQLGSMEIKLSAATQELETLKLKGDSDATEMVDLRRLKEESISKLLSAQDVINAKDREVVALKSDVKALTESKAELRLLLSEAKNALAEKEGELMARNTNDDLAAENVVLKAELQSLNETWGKASKLHADLIMKMETSHRTDLERKESTYNAHLANLDHLKNQLAEERCKNAALIGQCESVQSALNHARQQVSGQEVNYREAVEGLRTWREENAGLKEELRVSHADARELRARLDVQSVELFTAKSSLAMAQERIIASETLLEERSRRLAHLDGSVAEGRRRISELETTVSSLNVELAKLKDELEEKGSCQVRLSQDERLNALQLEVRSLRAKNEQSQKNEETLLERYQAGKLSANERRLVTLVISKTEAISEQDIATKEHELKRAHTLVETLQSKILAHEKVVSRFVKNRGETQLEKVQEIGEDTNPEEGQLMEVEPRPEPRLTNTGSGILASVTRPMAPMSSCAPRRVEEPESEDDIPLSEVSRMNEEIPTTSGTRSLSGLKRERPLERTAETSRRGRSAAATTTNKKPRKKRKSD